MADDHGRPTTAEEVLAIAARKKEKFWVVWAPRHGKPQVRHNSLFAAKKEAARLSDHAKGLHFYVLEMVDYVITGTPRLNRREKALLKQGESL